MPCYRPPTFVLPGSYVTFVADIIKACDSAPATTPTIDWDKWEATIKTPGVVAGFKESFGKLDIAPMEDTFTAKIDAKFAESVSLPYDWSV